MRFASDTDRLACERFFLGYDVAKNIFDDVVRYLDTLGGVQLTSTASRVAFVRTTKFAWVHSAPKDGLWLAFLAPNKVTSSRVRSAPVSADASAARAHRYSTHLKLTAAPDAEVKRWLRDAYKADT